MKRSIVNTNFNPNKTPVKIMNGFNLVDKSGVLQKKNFFFGIYENGIWEEQIP